MSANRREFLKAAGAATLGLALHEVKLVAKTRRIPKIPTIAQIIAASWSKTLKEMRDGHQWNSHVLNRWTTEGRIRIAPLGSGPHIAIEDDVPGYWHADEKVYVVTEDTSDLPITTVSRIMQYDIDYSHIPVTWTKNDEVKQDTEKKRIAFCMSLLQNVVYSAEDYLEMQAKKRKANLLVSQDCQLERGDVYQVVNQLAYYFIVSTVVAYIPQSVNLNSVKILTM